MASTKKVVCVTGAGGFVASWLVKLLLSKGYSVHGTVRQPGSQKYEHLLKLERASENLTLFKADVLNYESVYSAVNGCSAVFHVASPVPSTVVSNPEEEVIEPAVKGTANVLEACLQAKVERVVFVSSGAAITLSPNLPKDKVIDESYWSDKEYCKKTENWYCFSKTEAEEQALNFAKRTGLSVVSICPTLVLGPILQSTTNASSLVLIKLLKGCDSLANKLYWIVDVRDLVDALLLAYEKQEAEGRYICTSYGFRVRDLVEKLKSIYPNYKYPTENCAMLDEIRMGGSISKNWEPEDYASLDRFLLKPKYQVKSLHLSFNPWLLHGATIEILISIFPNLQLLDLSSSFDTSEIIMAVFTGCYISSSKLKQQLLPKLEVLNLSSSDIDDEALSVISKRFCGLLQLELENCNSVTEKGVREVVENCKQLREINLRNCYKVATNCDNVASTIFINVFILWMVLERPSLRKITAPPCFRPNQRKRKFFLGYGCLVC